MRVYAFVGPSGTGKSYRAQLVANENNIHYIIDDGLLIDENEVLAGTSAKKAPTKIETVRHALFVEKEEKEVELRNSQRQLEQMDGTKAVQDEKDKLASLKAKDDELKEKINVLKNLSVSMRDFIHSGLLDFELSDLNFV